MKHNQKKTAFLFLWLFICMLVCLGTGLLAVSRSEASFIKERLSWRPAHRKRRGK